MKNQYILKSLNLEPCYAYNHSRTIFVRRWTCIAGLNHCLVMYGRGLLLYENQTGFIVPKEIPLNLMPDLLM
jgi:hypothetical protein